VSVRAPAQVRSGLNSPPANLDTIISSTLEGRQRTSWDVVEAIIVAAVRHAGACCIALDPAQSSVPLWRQRYDDLFVRPGGWRPGVVLIAAGVTATAVVSFALGTAGTSGAPIGSPCAAARR